MAYVHIVYGHRYYGRVDRVPGLFHVATLFFHVNYLPLYPVQTVIIREGTDGSYANSGPPLSLYMKSVLVGYLRGWLRELFLLLAFGGGFVSGIAVYPLSGFFAFVTALLLGLGLGFGHAYVVTEAPCGRTPSALNRLPWQVALTGLTFLVAGAQLVTASLVQPLATPGQVQMLHVLPLVACGLLAAGDLLGYGYRLTLLLTAAGYERALELADELGVTHKLVDKRFRRRATAAAWD